MRGRTLVPWLVAAATTLFVALAPGVALAHGDLQSTDPAGGSRVGKAPRAVEIVFTEAPTNDSRFQVIDGCGNDVFEQASGEGDTRRLSVNGGQAGKWIVTYRVISAEDGHFTKGEFSFRVTGERDCSRDEVGTPGPRESDGPGVAEGPDGDVASVSTEPSILLIVLAGGAVIVLALAARFFSSR